MTLLKLTLYSVAVISYKVKGGTERYSVSRTHFNKIPYFDSYFFITMNLNENNDNIIYVIAVFCEMTNTNL